MAAAAAAAAEPAPIAADPQIAAPAPQPEENQGLLQPSADPNAQNQPGSARQGDPQINNLPPLGPLEP